MEEGSHPEYCLWESFTMYFIHFNSCHSVFLLQLSDGKDIESALKCKDLGTSKQQAAETYARASASASQNMSATRVTPQNEKAKTWKELQMAYYIEPTAPSSNAARLDMDMRFIYAPKDRGKIFSSIKCRLCRLEVGGFSKEFDGPVP
ncbi:hypothetical protein MAR_019101 [Mya arenaria]|uniref:Uncharacterized protein n=1 Tax=Mya arenaria TaxID=6604 RepID=A0ABY7EKI6_MYAAR|nr:hypothetical protein MAR_019101 [Mya arenaria]